MRLAERMTRIRSEGAFEVLSRARALESAGRDIIHLEIGEPDFPTPLNIVAAGKRALDEGCTRYGPTAGIPELRQAIAETRRTSAENVCVTPGAKPILFFVMLALLEPGDEVIYPDPGFPIYASMIDFLGAVGVPIPLVEERGFSLDLAVFERRLSKQTKVVILNSPQNPTGGVIPTEDVRALADLLSARDVIVISDEIYSRIWFDEEPLSIAGLPGMTHKTVIIDGFSKTYAMTGWRLGYGIMPVWLANAVNMLMVNSNSCTATFTQRAGVEALTGPQDEVARMVAEFRRRRDHFCAALSEIPGVRCTVPQGAFYAFPNITGTGWRSKPLADALLEKAGVAALSGTAFGTYGEGYLRFSIANSLEHLLEAADRIQRFLASNTPPL